jgi:CO/xanthine dehydrogenase Mo-binding subunit
VIGTSIGRRDGRGKVTGATTYTADVRLRGTLYGGILRSPLPFARILRVDTSAARALPGVHAVLAGVDLPAALLAGRSLSDVPVLCRDVVRFVGDRVAAVAAETRPALEAALAAIEVEYDELPGAVFDPTEAMRPDAPVLHPDFLSYRGAPRNP